MKRRTVLTSIGMGVLGQQAFLRAGAFAQAPKVVPAAEYEPFQKIAKAKGVKIFINQDRPSANANEVSVLHLDMNMVQASIENAIARTKDPELNQKLRRLLTNGTAVQKVEFVHGSGRYYFPEDMERAIAASTRAAAASDSTCWICHEVCTLVCNCLGNGDQYCKDKCREVCSRHC